MIGVLISVIIYILILGLVFWVLRYAINTVPMDPQFRSIANMVLTVFAVIILLLILLNLLGFVDIGVRPIVLRGP